MQTLFKCPDCNAVFDSQGAKHEYHSPVYGPCWKYVSNCPRCNTLSDEYREPNPSKKSSVSEPEPARGGCCSGGRCGL